MEKKPLISICLISYNQEEYIGAAIDSVFSQTYSPLEIILSDDCSSDKTFEIIKAKAKNYEGDNKLIINKNSKNLGLVEHVNKVILTISKGKYVQLAAGDDIMFHDKTQNIWNIFKNNSELVAVGGHNVIIDESGIIKKSPKFSKDEFIKYNIDDYISRSIHISHRIFKREVMDIFGPLNPQCPTEDTTLFFRSILLGDVALMNKPSIYYRVHGKGISYGENIYKLSYLEIYKQYLRDIETAFKHKYITAIQKKRLHKRIDRYQKKEEILYKLSSNYNKSRINHINLIIKLIFSRYFSLKEKINLIVKMIR